MKSRMNQQLKNNAPFETPQSFREPEPHPCPAEAPVRELNNQVILLAHKVEHLQGILFKVVADMVRSGNLDQAVAMTCFDNCVECRAELQALAKEQPARIH